MPLQAWEEGLAQTLPSQPSEGASPVDMLIVDL